jgi:hypothetical protein
MSNCLVKPVEGEPVLCSGLSMSMLERQLLADVGTHRALIADAEPAAGRELRLVSFCGTEHTVDPDKHVPPQAREPALRHVLCEELEEYVSDLARCAARSRVASREKARHVCSQKNLLLYSRPSDVNSCNHCPLYVVLPTTHGIH